MSHPSQVSPSKKHWRAPTELSDADPVSSSDEFTPEVARAMAVLRQQHGLTNASCQPAGNETSELQALRSDLGAFLPGVNRRGFMQLTGAAAVFALAGCYKKHPDTLVPYAQQPEGTTIGNAVYYSSTLRDSGQPVGVMVKTYDGRPIKIEGNPDHPLSRGRCDVRTQASLLNLYDPDRLQDGPQQIDRAAALAHAQPISWVDLDAKVGASLRSGGIALVTPPIDGPANRQLIDEFSAACAGRLLHVVIDPGDVRERELLGNHVVWRADRADLMVTLGGDFIGGAGTGLAELIEFGDMRRLRDGSKTTDDARPAMGQLIAFEATLSQTGAVADVRVRVDAQRMGVVAWAIAHEVASALGQALPSGVAETLAAFAKDKSVGAALGLKLVNGEDAISFAARRLIEVKKAGRNSLVYPGATVCSDDQVTPIYQAAYFLNAILGNGGITVDTAGVAQNAVAGRSLEVLSATLAQKSITTLIVVGCNPLFTNPNLASAFANATTVVVLDDRITDTGMKAHLVAPTLHGLESWDDAEARAGILSLQQPTIQPLWDCRAWQESLMAFARQAGIAPASFLQAATKADDHLVSVIARKPIWQANAYGIKSWMQYLKQTWLSKITPQAGVASDDRGFWNSALARGVLTLASERPSDGDFSKLAAKATATVALNVPPADGALALLVRPSRTMGDGRWLNNAWLQELPDPISKICWDNYLALSPADAKSLGFGENEVVSLTVSAGSTTAMVQLPVHIQEGQQPGVLETFSGWGRAKGCAGAVADLGVDFGYSIDCTPLGQLASLPGAKITVATAGKSYELACAQGHQRMDGRDIVRDDVLELHQIDPGARARRAERRLWEQGSDGKPDGRLSLYGDSQEYPARQWGMSVDLGTCIGCNACIVACIAENNIPVVGRDEVRKQRLMHWLRIDRYYSSAPGASSADDQLDVEVAYLPVMCQQCGKAPCEEVCPAMATVHNDEGINHMVYNRCIGTRYCSNNCPYKVRRFNWYEYSKFRAGPVNSQTPLVRIAKNISTEGSTSSQAELSRHPLEMLLNPTVTVRSRGVMEKCNFCLQRTREVREREKTTDRRIVDGEITSACAQTCPTKAIVFGDMRDPAAEVNRGMRADHGYRLLDEELNTRPSVAYLAKVRNRPASVAERKVLDDALAAAKGESEGVKAGEARKPAGEGAVK